MKRTVFYKMPVMTPTFRSLKWIFFAWVLFYACGIFAPWRAPAIEVVLKDGRVLRGKLGEVSGLAEVPQPPSPDGEGPLQLILLVDDNLSRTFVAKRLVKELRPEQAGQAEEKFTLHQRALHSGNSVASVGPAMSVLPFDEFGRRTFTMYTVKGPVHVIQGITELTPRCAKVEGISHVWDMRIATNSIPRDVLSKILLKQINPNDIEQIKKVARFYLQSERYEDARQTLDELLKDHPDLEQDLKPALRAIKQLSARQLSAELKVRSASGQHGLVWNALKQFPTDEVAGEVLQTARDLLDEYETKAARRAKVFEKFDELLPKIPDASQREKLGKIRGEMAADLNFNTVDRMAAFLQNADDAQMSPQEKLALAAGGWLLGRDSAVDQLSVALAMYSIRAQVRDYLGERVKLKRDEILDGLKSQEGMSPALIAQLLSHMKPPIDPPPPVSPERPGFFRLEVPGLAGEQPITYWVQLPPEYDPYRLYPAIVTLNGAANNAESQIDWWSGEWVQPRQAPEKNDEEKGDGTEKGDRPPFVKGPVPFYRNGQAARYGYIVIAPEWNADHQKQYNYSAREHAAVLNSLRDACRRFSIDTDRVFLSGYSMGGDAAWDIGLAHPDLWAGVIPISGLADRYCNFYWENAKYLPFYVVLGELDDARLSKNALNLDRYMKRGFDTTVIEYEGRGHDDFHEEILRIFDWMGRFRRNFFPREFTCATMRDWDSFFWWVEMEGMPTKAKVDPADWPPPAGARAVQVKGTITANNLSVMAGTAQISVWVSPQMVDYNQRVSITVNGQRINAREPFLQGDLRTILEDVRTRGDRQHPFWTRIVSGTGRAREK
jgi:predicted esterase/tetratricopeptide (TPR) repeat protein